MSSNNRRNEYAIEESNLASSNIDNQMEKFKEEIAAEIGLMDYNNMDKRWIPAVQHGYVGGNMTRRMIQYAEQAIRSQGSQVMSGIKGIDLPEDVRRANELVSQNFQQFTEAIKSGNLLNLVNGTQETTQNNQNNIIQ